MSQLEVYWGSGSQPAWRTLLALEFKGIAYDSKLISFQKGEHKTPEFLAMNPRHKVPTLRQGDFVVYESLAILAYLEAAYPHPPLFGREPEQTGMVWRHVMEFLNYVEKPLQDIIRPVFFDKVEEHREQIEAAKEPALAELAGLEAKLAYGEYFVGDVSAADIVAYPTLKALQRAISKPNYEQVGLDLSHFGRRFPRLGAWMERIELLPGYDKTYPPHWR